MPAITGDATGRTGEFGSVLSSMFTSEHLLITRNSRVSPSWISPAIIKSRHYPIQLPSCCFFQGLTTFLDDHRPRAFLYRLYSKRITRDIFNCYATLLDYERVSQLFSLTNVAYLKVFILTNIGGP